MKDRSKLAKYRGSRDTMPDKEAIQNLVDAGILVDEIKGPKSEKELEQLMNVTGGKKLGSMNTPKQGISGAKKGGQCRGGGIAIRGKSFRGVK